MIGRINHVAMVVPDLDVAAAQWRDILGADISVPKILVEHGVRIVFVRSVNGQVELMEPYGEKSPVAGFLQRNPDGGMHHICYEVSDIGLARQSLEAKGARIIGDGLVKLGAHGNPVLFLHPKDFHGTLIELEQISGSGTD
ncbi:MAG: methylmalonyl-CoA epimerase [Candidatus Puniceispirillaceae bacterium]